MADKSNTGNATELNFIGKGTVIDGNVKTDNSIRIDGGIKGKLISKNTVTVGETGRVQGDIESVNAIIAGKVKGKVVVGEKLVLESTASLIGELKAKKLIIDEGSVFEGTSDMGVTGSADSSAKPVPPSQGS